MWFCCCQKEVNPCMLLPWLPCCDWSTGCCCRGRPLWAPYASAGPWIRHCSRSASTRPPGCLPGRSRRGTGHQPERKDFLCGWCPEGLGDQRCLKLGWMWSGPIGGKTRKNMPWIIWKLLMLSRNRDIQWQCETLPTQVWNSPWKRMHNHLHTITAYNTVIIWRWTQEDTWKCG